MYYEGGGEDEAIPRVNVAVAASFDACFGVHAARSPIHSGDVLQTIDQDLVREFNSSTLGYQWQVSFAEQRLVSLLFAGLSRESKKRQY